MSAEENEALVRRFGDELWNQGKLEILDEVYDPDGQSASAAIFKQEVVNLRSAFPDLLLSVEHMVATDAQVAVHWRLHGTHQGTLHAIELAEATSRTHGGEDHPRWAMELAPTGRRVIIDGTSILGIRDGRIVSAWVLTDRLGMLQQLGALPSPFRDSR